jgi:putative nucleotidyltransferase with HDIG domain
VALEARSVILIVEDDAGLASFLTDLLVDEGHEPIVAMGGRSALEVLDNRAVDLVLLDIGLPDIDGYSVLSSIRQGPLGSLLPVILMTARRSAREKIAALGVGADEYLAKPFDLDELLARIKTLLRVRRAELELMARNRELELARAALQESYDGTLEALASAIDARDAYTHSHSRAVSHYALRIAHHLGLPACQHESLGRGALLHDIGKIAISDAILRKPAPLTAEERREVEQHPEVGFHMLPAVTFLQDALPIIRYHHERIDGRGYPCGLEGHEIPIGAKIVAVADAFHAMMSHRPYRRALTYSEARGELCRESGTHFDAEVVGAFTQAFDGDDGRIDSRA